MIPGKQYRPEDLLLIAWRRKLVIVLPFLAIAVATAFGATFLKNKYRSETLILVVPQRVPESYVRATVTARIEDRLQSISQQILSRPRLERIIQDYNLYVEQRKTGIMEDVVQRMRSEIEVQVVKGDAFRVAYVADEPRTTMRVVERLASLFIEENLRDREVLAEGTNQFLEAQMEDARRRLIEHEKKLSDYQREHADDLPSQLNFNLQAQHNAEMQVQALLDSLNSDRDRRLLLERQIADASLADVDPAPTPSAGGIEASGPETVAQQLVQARNSLAALETRFKPEHPDVIRMKRTIRDLETKAAAESKKAGLAPLPAAVISPAHSARINRLDELRVELEKLNQQIAAKEEQEKRVRGSIQVYQHRIGSAPSRASEMSELNRDYETLQQIYRNLLQKNEDSKVAANLERRQIGEQFKVIEPARVPERPISPNRLQIDLIGALIGLGLGVGLAGLLEYFDTALRTEADVILAVGVPVLALLPLVETERFQRRRRIVRVMWAVSAAMVLALSLAGLAWKLRA